VNARNNSRDTPLLDALKSTDLESGLENRRLEVARLLVEHGANIDAKNDEGMTAFQVASEYGYHDIAKLLSDHGSK
jgi:ankyrin repeat protein